MSECYLCRKNAAGDGLEAWERIHVDDRWRLTHAFDASLPGWLVLVPQRHVTGLHQLTAAEAAGMGELLHEASCALVEVTGCQRTYVMLFAEADGFAHLHVHLVPRAADLPVEHRGPGVFAYLGVPADQHVPDEARLAVTLRLQRAMHR